MFQIYEAVQGANYLYGLGERTHMFGIPNLQNNYVTWHSCREQAGRAIVGRKPNYIWFKFNACHPYSNNFTTTAWNVARWFYYIEGRMGWHQRTAFNWVHDCEVLKVTPASVWLRDNMTISLFTLMLRVGRMCSEGTSLEENLLRDPYTSSTLNATHRFLQGFNFYIGRNIVGWLDAFNNSNWDNACRQLVQYGDVEKTAYHMWESNGRIDHANPMYYWNLAKIRMCA